MEYIETKQEIDNGQWKQTVSLSLELSLLLQVEKRAAGGGAGNKKQY